MLCFNTYSRTVKRIAFIITLIIVSVTLLFRQNKISAYYSYESYDEIKNNKILTTKSSLDKNLSFKGLNIRPFLKKFSAKYFSFICHQNQSILMRIKGGFIPLCPRCMSLHLSFIITFCVLTIFTNDPIRIATMISYMIILIGLATTGMEWILAHFSIIQSNSISRIVTGNVTGTAFGILALLYKRTINCRVFSRYFSLREYHVIGLIFTSLFVIALIILSNSWIVIDVLLLVSVTVNFIILMHILILRLTSVIQLLILNHLKS